ncbi:type IV toxin-antitoxin system AbiEi family antitoxin [Accumulibacter sp.]|uniref:type IV toxin-antitoxin system AbiEi family antitoxin n=1 Tax=Accumulibacter sp. TaxID=2053492 RepID=UPI0025DDE6CF|nr:type IV toxin-antitoxin system AbiEi family antitoxin [Accumulibacter sp.]MCP5228330.1 hypothetical protein [Accumulibacter sp.]
MSEQEQITLLERVVQALQGHGLTVRMRNEASGRGAEKRPGTWLGLGKDSAAVDYAAQVKGRLTPGTLGAVVAQLRHPVDAGGPVPLLLADYVSPPLASQLREYGQQFADSAGNAYLEGRGLFVFVSGRKLHPKQRELRASTSFSTTRLKVLFALICDPELAGAPYRKIAAAADVALGAMPAVVADLRQHGSLIVTDKQRCLDASKRVLDEWAQAYALGLRGKTLSERYRAEHFDSWRDWQLNPAHTRWGGEAAANLLLGGLLLNGLAPSVLTLYGDKLPARLTEKQGLEVASPAAYEHLVELRKPFWGPSLMAAAEESATVPAELVYADLLATGNARCIEAAELLYRSRLIDRFPPY